MSEAKERKIKRKIRGIFEVLDVEAVKQLLADDENEQQQYENERNVQQQMKRKIFN